MVSPELPATPANVTRPVLAALTRVPTGAAMSMPRCWPAAYGSSPFLYGVMTSPRTGQAQSVAAAAGGASVSAARSAARKAMYFMPATVDRRADAGEPFSHACAFWCSPVAERHTPVAERHSSVTRCSGRLQRRAQPRDQRRDLTARHTVRVLRTDEAVAHERGRFSDTARYSAFA